jgi:hypothetical protein
MTTRSIGIPAPIRRSSIRLRIPSAPQPSPHFYLELERIEHTAHESVAPRRKVVFCPRDLLAERAHVRMWDPAVGRGQAILRLPRRLGTIDSHRTVRPDRCALVTGPPLGRGDRCAPGPHAVARMVLYARLDSQSRYGPAAPRERREMQRLEWLPACAYVHL